MLFCPWLWGSKAQPSVPGGGCRESGVSPTTCPSPGPVEQHHDAEPNSVHLAGVGMGMPCMAERCILAGEAGDKIRMGYCVTTVGSFFEVNKTRQTIAAA